MTSGGSERLPYRPELDGLRAVAVGLVLAAHAQLVPADFGQAGVSLFFVLSGYLITSLLAAELARTGRIGLRAFYLRRVIRLTPALAAMLAGVVLLGLVGAWTGPWLEGVGWAMTYTGNNATALGFPWQTPASHTWSLNIEEQFYALWPLALMIVGRRWLLPLCIGSVLLAVPVRHAMHPTFAIHFTLTRIDSIALGCALALSGRVVPRWLGAVGLGVVVIAGLAPSAWAIDLATAGAVLAVGSTLPLGALAAAGKRAYSLYLWSWPMTLLLPVPAAMAATLGAAEASYRFVERPIIEWWRRRLDRPRRDTDLPVAEAAHVA